MKKIILIILLTIITGCYNGVKEDAQPNKSATEAVIIDLDNTYKDNLEYSEVMIMYLNGYSVLSFVITNKQELPIEIEHLLIKLFDQDKILLAQNSTNIEEIIESENSYSVVLTFDEDLTKVTSADYFLWDGSTQSEITECEIDSKC